MNNSLAEVHPELVFEWSEKNLPLTPDDITFMVNTLSGSVCAYRKETVKPSTLWIS